MGGWLLRRMRRTLLTADTIEAGLWILDEENRLAQIIKVDDKVRRYYPNEKTFTYKLYKGHCCWTSIGKSGRRYPKYILTPFFVRYWKVIYFLRSVRRQQFYIWFIARMGAKYGPVGVIVLLIGLAIWFGWAIEIGPFRFYQLPLKRFF